MSDLLWRWEVYLTFVEVRPVGDVKSHLLGDECWCDPELFDVEGGDPALMISHNQYNDAKELTGVNPGSTLRE
jgi:hypothetical protein